VILFQRYLGKSIYVSTVFVLCAFLSMFLFFDVLAEMDEVGMGGYKFRHALLYVLLGIPNRVYELAPIAALIGTLWALSQSASNSEFTVFRVSGLMPQTAISTMLKIGLPMIVVTAIFSELLVPVAEELRSAARSGAFMGQGSGSLRSGLWLRDTPNVNGVQNKAQNNAQNAKSPGGASSAAPLSASGKGSSGASNGSQKEMRFLNAKAFTAEQVLLDVVIYDFDSRQRLLRSIEAKSAHYVGETDIHRWELRQVAQTTFGANGVVSRKASPTMVVTSLLSPETMGALVTNPDRMSSRDLYRYVAYLKQNKQQSERYEIAFWKRVIYPFAIWVMMLLALPAAFLQARAGAVGARVFGGILVGVGFHLLNSLFSHLGVLNTWPAPLMAMTPSLIALAVAAFFLYRVQYR
jgi:lipopolysaccharide export system permease protein